jgi:hypothetical protein
LNHILWTVWIFEFLVKWATKKTNIEYTFFAGHWIYFINFIKWLPKLGDIFSYKQFTSSCFTLGSSDLGNIWQLSYSSIWPYNFLYQVLSNFIVHLHVWIRFRIQILILKNFLGSFKRYHKKWIYGSNTLLILYIL